MLAAYRAILKGAAEVYIVDNSKERLKRAESIGAIPVNFEDGDSTQQIMEMRQNKKKSHRFIKTRRRKNVGS